jgi:pyoverdine/dityrosine biosynthesis protein Dit1
MTFFVFSVFPAPDSPLCRSVNTDKVVGQRPDVRDQDALVLTFFVHADPGALSYCEDMRSIFVPPLVPVLLNDGISVEGQLGVGIDCD